MKLYRKGSVYPAPPPLVSDQLLYFLPAALLTLAAALSSEEREVLAYLISCSSASFPNNSYRRTSEHTACFSCYCFRCYTSFWVKWDSSPNRQLIHEIIDAYEDSLLKESRRENVKRERRRGRGRVNVNIEFEEPRESEPSLNKDDSNLSEHDLTGSEEESEEEEEAEKGSMRSFVSFLGERIWSVWGWRYSV